jgi:DNA-3-methyladenine glycosylase II
LLRSRADRLSRLGLSADKIKTLKHIAREIAEKRLDIDALTDADADEAHRTLTSLHGVGPWTADIYLLFCLGHGDAWPAGDLALQEAMRIGLNLPVRPTANDMSPLAEDWRPFRGVAAHLWWAYYKVARNREGALAPAETVNTDTPLSTAGRRATTLTPSSRDRREPASYPAPTAAERRTTSGRPRRRT